MNARHLAEDAFAYTPRRPTQEHENSSTVIIRCGQSPDICASTSKTTAKSLSA
jgi:hypothetical protein